MASENPVGENNPTPNAGEKSNVQSDNVIAGVSPTISTPKLPPSHCHCEITYKTEKDWWDKNKKWMEIAGVILLAIYTASTILMYCANNKAANAARDAAKVASQTLCETQRNNARQEYLSDEARLANTA